MSEISREKAIIVLENGALGVGIVEDAKNKAISDMEKLQKIEEIVRRWSNSKLVNAPVLGLLVEIEQIVKLTKS